MKTAAVALLTLLSLFAVAVIVSTIWRDYQDRRRDALDRQEIDGLERIWERS